MHASIRSLTQGLMLCSAPFSDLVSAQQLHGEVQQLLQQGKALLLEQVSAVQHCVLHVFTDCFLSHPPARCLRQQFLCVELCLCTLDNGMLQVSCSIAPAGVSKGLCAFFVQTCLNECPPASPILPFATSLPAQACKGCNAPQHCKGRGPE